MIGTFRDIRLFVAAYEESSFTAAAEREHATQSGVSQHMRKLELGLGVALFLREGGKIVPTPAAHAYYSACVEVMKWHAESIKVTRSFTSGLQGDLVVGLMPTLTRCILAPALAEFVNHHPNVSVRIIEGYSADLTRQVQNGTLDLAIVPVSAQLPGVRARPFGTTPEMIISRRGSQFEPGAPVALSDCLGLRVITPSKINARYETLRRYFTSNDVGIVAQMELDAMLGTLDMVARSDWIAIVPALLLDPESDAGNFTINPVVAPPMLLPLAMIEPVRKQLSASAEAFLELIRQACLGHGDKLSIAFPSAPLSQFP